MTLPEILQHLALRARSLRSGPAIDATHSFITPYSFSCMALRRWESSTLIAAFLPGQESAATKLLAPTKLSAPFDWPPQSLS